MTRDVDYTRPRVGRAVGRRRAPRPSSRRAVPGRARVLGTTLASRPAGADKVVVPRTGHFRRRAARCRPSRSRRPPRCYERARGEHARDGRTLHFVGHQANLRMLEAVCRRCDIAAERHHSNVEWFGNTAARRRAVGDLACAGTSGRPSDDVAVVGVGAGLTWSSYLLRFGARHDVRRVPAPRAVRPARSCSPSRTAGWSRMRRAGFAARLPLPPMLMVDRVVEIARDGSRGRIVAERDVKLDDWFFQCHFLGDPVQPGCLGVDGVWQLLGFYCAWAGGLGAGRALGCGEVEFFGQIRPHDRRGALRGRRPALHRAQGAGASMVIGDAKVLVDGEAIYTIKRRARRALPRHRYADADARARRRSVDERRRSRS